MGEDGGRRDDAERAAELRAHIEATRAQLAATAEALAARAAAPPAEAVANLPVPYRPAEARRTVTVVGAVVGVVVLASRLRRRLRR